jgi:hypothetical protein
MRSPARHSEFIILNDEDKNGKVPGIRCQVSGKTKSISFYLYGFPET